MNNIGKTITFCEMIKQNAIFIPKIQRDYVQYRKSNEEKLKPLQDYSANYLDEKLAKQGLKAIYKTKDKADGRYLSRGESILEYVYRNNVENYIILDDCQFDYDGLGLTDYFIKIKQTEGLTEAQAEKACKILSEQL